MENEVNLKDFFKILIVRKWWFIGTFIIVLISGLLFNFLQKPIYSSTSKIRLADNYIYYNDQLYNYFPEETANLWISPTHKYITYEERNVIEIFNNIQTGEIFDLAVQSIDLEISKQKLKEAYRFSITDNDTAVYIETFYKDPQIAYELNKSLLEIFIPEQNRQFEEVYNDLMVKLDSKLKTIEEELAELSEEAIESIAVLNSMYVNELEKYGLSHMQTDEIKFVDPVLENKINYKFNDYIILDSIKRNLNENREFMLNRIEIIKTPEVSYTNQKENNIRNIIIILIAAIISAVIVSFLVNYFNTRRKNK